MFAMFAIGPMELLMIAVVVVVGGGLLFWMFSGKG